MSVDDIKAWQDDPEVQAFLDAQDAARRWAEEDDKIHTIGGLTNDKESGFMDFQKKQAEFDEEWDEDHALDMVMNDMVKDIEEEEIDSLPAEARGFNPPSQQEDLLEKQRQSNIPAPGLINSPIETTKIKLEGTPGSAQRRVKEEKTKED